MKVTCETFATDPDRYAAHVEECEACRKVVADLEAFDQRVSEAFVEPSRPLATDLGARLPLASWEGAGHRAWPLVAALAAGVAGVAAALFFVGGIPPLAGIAQSMAQPFRAITGWIDAVPVVSEFVHRAPRSIHLLVAVAFVVVNVVLVRLLRRAPRGIDVAGR